MITFFKIVVGGIVIFILASVCFRSIKSFIAGVSRRLKNRKSSDNSVSADEQDPAASEKEVDSDK